MSVVGSQEQALDDLVVRAVQGDTRAAATYYAETLPYLHGAARRFGPDLTTDEREDLVQDAWAKLLGKWATGTGPDQNVRAYLVRIMRNAYLDERMSARSRVSSLHALDDEPEDLNSGTGFDRVDFLPETRLVRKAYDSLNPKYRQLLNDSVIDGLKPAEIAALRGRTSGAISTQLVRARHRLRYATLVQYLSLGGAECARHARNLPESAVDHDEPSDGLAGTAHQRTCPDCRRNWRRFVLIVEGLGIVPLLAIGNMALGSTPADAAAAREQEPSPSSASAAARLPRSTGGVRKAARWTSVVSSRWFAVGAIGLVSLSAPFFVGASLAGSAPDVDAGHAVSAGAATEISFDAWLVPGDAEETLRMRLSGQEGIPLRMDSFTLQLPEGAELARTPEGAECEVSATGDTVCVFEAEASAVDVVVRADGGGIPSGGFRIDIGASASGDDGGSEIAAWAQGDF